MTWTKAQDDLIRQRYSAEGASLSLIEALGQIAWKVRRRATVLGVRMDQKAKQRKRLFYNGSKFR